MIKRAQKKKHSSNTTQLLGRGRKERELDGLFNRQAKKIVKRKQRDSEKARYVEKQLRRHGGRASKAALVAARVEIATRNRRHR